MTRPNKASTSSKVAHFLLQKGKGFEFTSKDLARHIGSKSEGAITGYVSHVKQLGAVEIVRGSRKRGYAYVFSNPEKLKFRTKSIGGSVKGRKISRQTFGTQPILELNVEPIQTNGKVTGSDTHSPWDTFNTNMPVLELNGEPIADEPEKTRARSLLDLSETLLGIAAELSELARNPFANVSSAELAEEIVRRMDAKA